MKKNVLLLVGSAISLICLWWVFKGVRWADMLAALLSFHWTALIPSVFFFYLSMYLRAVRWSVLFRPRYELTGRHLFRPVMIGFAFNSILPARVGEAMRAVYVGRHERTGTSTAVTTIITERLFDGLTLLVFLGGALLVMPRIDPLLEVNVWGVTVRGGMIDEFLPSVVWGALGLLAIVGLFLVPRFHLWLRRVIDRLPFVSETGKKHLLMGLQGVGVGLESLRSLRNLAEIVFYSFLIWIGVALSIWTLAFGFPKIPLSFVQSVALMTLIAFFVMVPAAPGYWGLFEAGAVFMLLALGVQQDKSIATAYAIVMHLVQFLPLVVVGLFFASRSPLALRSRKASRV